MKSLITTITAAAFAIASPLPAAAITDAERLCQEDGGHDRNGHCVRSSAPPTMDLFGVLIVGILVLGATIFSSGSSD
jgi:Predicted integral membrane protein